MKNQITLMLIIGLALMATSKTFAQVGFGTNLPDKSAAVEIVSSQRGLLIPRIDIPDLNNAAPVTNPANSLLVFNTGTSSGTEEGFYYWDVSLDKWVRFIASNTEKTVVVDAGNNIQVQSNTNTSTNTTTYTVGMKPSSTDGEVLVTKDLGGGNFTTQWVDPADFVNGVINADNGLTYNAATSTVKLGGALSQKHTIIQTDGINKDLAITNLEDLSSSFNASNHYVVVMDNTGVLQRTSVASLVETQAKNLSLEPALEFTGTNTNGNGALLKGLKIGISNNSIGAEKLKSNDGAGGNAPAGTVAIADGNGNVTYDYVTPQDLSGKKDLTLEPALEFTAGDGTQAVLENTKIGIKNAGITTTMINPGANDQVLVTDASGNVKWLDQSTFTQTNQSTVSLSDGNNTTVSSTVTGTNTDYQVNVATANGTTLGVVQENATNPTVNINNGELSVNLSNTSLSGDVTGPLNNTKVVSIQGTDVAGTNPTGDQVLQYNNTSGKWEPSTLDGSAITGYALTSSSLDIPTNTALLQNLNIEIKPGSTDGTILTTTGGGTTTTWATPNSLVTVNNGLNKANPNNEIRLGGDLIENTTVDLKTKELTFKTNANNKMAVTGLQAPSTGPSTEKDIMVVDKSSGVLRTVARSIKKTSVTANTTVNSISNYSPYVQEVTISADITASDVKITLPDPTNAEGQVINVKVANSTGNHYANIYKSDGTTIFTYGALKHQGWVFKSVGSEWIIVGRY